MKKKKTAMYFLSIAAALLAAFIYYYVTLPAINIHSSGFWFFIMGALVFIILIYIIKKTGVSALFRQEHFQPDFKKNWPLKIMSALFVGIIIFYLGGTLLSSPIINAKKYRELLNVEERNFTDDIKQVDYNTIPLLDKNSAALLGDRKMGSMVEMVSQFEVGSDFTQINCNGKPVRVSPLVYASPIKWLTNRKNGIPAYMMIDMATQDTECVMLEQGIKYSKSEYFNRNLYRHLRFSYPTYIFDDQIFFEIDENGTPYWVCPVKKFNIGLFGGQTIGRAVLCNAITGECTDYAIEDVPQWVDKVYSADLLIRLFDYHGSLVHGYFNSVLGQKDCLTTTEGYNYIALDDDVWVYTGITSLNGDQSNVGFTLMNQRTMETRYYKVEGATETSAMSSAEGQVQNLRYQSTFPLLLNIANEPTYFMALKDNAGLVKKYAMVNVQKYQLVAIGDTIQECEKDYVKLLNQNGLVDENAGAGKEASGIIEAISPVVLDGNTHYYIAISGNDAIFDVDMSDDALIGIIRVQTGDFIHLTYREGYGLHRVQSFEFSRPAFGAKDGTAETANKTSDEEESSLSADAQAEDDSNSCNPSMYDEEEMDAAEAFAKAFLKNLGEGKKEEVASAMEYPLEVNLNAENGNTKSITIPDAEAFLAKYDSIMTKDFLAKVITKEPLTLIANYQGFGIGLGEIWFYPAGDSFAVYFLNL